METLYFHRRIKKNDQIHTHGGMTFAVTPTEGGLLIGMAKCSVNDHFNRRIGREVAHTRVREMPMFVPVFTDDKEQLMIAARQIVDSTFVRHSGSWRKIK